MTKMARWGKNGWGLSRERVVSEIYDKMAELEIKKVRVWKAGLMEFWNNGVM